MKLSFMGVSALLIGLGLLLTSCSDEIVTNEAISNEASGEKIILGEEVDMPYTVENIATAYSNLLFNLKTTSKQSKLAGIFGKEGDDIEIMPSHYYYRFLPKDSLEYELIINDTILNVSNVPLHYEIEQEGDFYDDPELEGDETADSFSYLYSVLPYDYEFPKEVYHEHLNNFYFAPELDEDEELEKGEIPVKQPKVKTTDKLLTVDESGEVFEYLELEALKLTNNLDEEELEALRFYLPNDDSGTTYSYEDASAMGYEQSQLIIDLVSVEEMLLAEAQTERRKWYPSGTITVEEDAIYYKDTIADVSGYKYLKLPVQGAEVKVRKWGFLVIRKAYTDENGYFKTRSTRTKRVKYAAHFNGDWHRVMAGSIFVRAMHRGTKKYKRKSWNQNFSSGRSQFYALVHNAAYDYYSRIVPEYGLKKPRHCRIKAQYNDDGKGSEHRPDIFSSNAFVCDIRVSRFKSGGEYRGTDGIYGTTIHELTHAGHRELDPGIFSVVARSCEREVLMESWAEGVETIVTNDRYKLLESAFMMDYNERYQKKSPEKMNEYTPVVTDLIDDLNQRLEYSNGIIDNYPNDEVTGYTLKQIQSALKDTRKITTWCDKLKNNLPGGVSASSVDELFEYVTIAKNNEGSCD